MLKTMAVQTLSDSEQDLTETAPPPPGVITWRSPAERNKLLINWRCAVSIAFAEQPRCLRVAWMLDHLFSAKTGYCNASNTHLSKLTGLPVTKVQEALAKLENDGAIRRITPAPGKRGQRWRAIYPATFLTSTFTREVTPTVGVTGNLQQVGVQNLSKRTPRWPKTQMDAARLQAAVRDGTVASGRDNGNASAQQHDAVASPRDDGSASVRGPQAAPSDKGRASG